MRHIFHTPARLRLAMAVLLALSITAPAAHAQHGHKWYNSTRLNADELFDYCMQHTASDLAARQEPLVTLSIERYLLDNQSPQLWTNGYNLFQSVYSPEERKVFFEYLPTHEPVEEPLLVKPMNVKGKSAVTLGNRAGARVSVVQVAGHIMLVARDTQGQVVYSLIHVDEQERNDNTWTVAFLYTLMGNYEVPGGDAHAVFGPRMDFYTGDKYDTDPGIINGYHINDPSQPMSILYGNGRVSRGNPNSDKWGKMPGGGGAGAIMEPMEWDIRPTAQGLSVHIVHDVEFVSHEPAIGQQDDTVILTKVQCPYEGLRGKWAFASVIPLTHDMLQWFPKEVLTLMRAEIYARHGDTFKDPATQRYFDAQPWYSKTGGPVSLTDLERINYSLIKHVESTK